MSTKTTIRVDVGVAGMDFQGGNFLNAINEVVCHFQQHTSLENSDIEKLLLAYAEGLDNR